MPGHRRQIGHPAVHPRREVRDHGRMYWSNAWTGAIILVLALGTFALTLARPQAAR
jgi:hypothetical protein